jgi:hypothetical protein
MKYPKTTSRIASAVHEDAERYVDLDAEPGMNPSGGTPYCGNREALEDLFVAATAHWFTRQMQLPFQHVVYAPNRRIEARCGFDLSIAPVNSERLRLRIQSKVSPTWCDTVDTIELPAERYLGGEVQSDANRLHHQVGLLCGMWIESKQKAYPYLLVQQCFCLHEYRRMGQKVLDVDVPTIEAPLRSMAIDLSNEAFINKCLSKDTWKIQIETNPTNGLATCNGVITGGETVPLVVRSLAALVKQLRGESFDA